MGASIIEKHFTLDTSLPGPDHKISADPATLKEIRRLIDLAFAMRADEKNEALPEELASDEFGKRSLYTIGEEIVALRPRNKDLPRDSDYLNS